MKSERTSKILGLALFVVLIGWILFLSIVSERKGVDEQVKLIKITGNTLLNENDYLVFAKLSDAGAYKGLTLPVIKSRLEKHPYVQRADVEFSGNNTVHINLIEKKIKAVLISKNEMFLSSDNFEILPLIPYAKVSGFPVISNLNNNELLRKNETFKTEGLVEAYKIIDAVGLIDADLSKKLSEINLRGGGDIILLFSGLKPPVILGKGDTAKKMIAFDQLLALDSSQKDMVMNSSYIDLRFQDEIFLGNSDNTGLTE